MSTARVAGTVSIEPAFCGLMPHAPIVVPAVSRGRPAACRNTVTACEDLAGRLVAARPDRLFLVSPHSPRQRRAFGLWAGQRLRGDLAQFGASHAAVDLPADRPLLEALADTAAVRGLHTWSIPSQPLDHGAVVPLWFLAAAGWGGPTAIASLPLVADAASAFGQAVAAALAGLRGRPALVASGDLTHRAQPGAPAGYVPEAVEFDRALVRLIAEQRLRGIPDIDGRLRAVAAEDAADSATVVAAAIDYRAHGCEVLSYEHPFGVGYLVAVFHDGGGKR